MESFTCAVPVTDEAHRYLQCLCFQSLIELILCALHWDVCLIFPDDWFLSTSSAVK